MPVLIKIYRVKTENGIQGVIPEIDENENYELLGTLGGDLDATKVVYDDSKTQLGATRLDNVIEKLTFRNPYVYKPRNLKDVLGITDLKQLVAKIRELASKGDFSNFLLGDYFDLPSINDGTGNITWNEDWQNLRCMIVAFDHYYQVGDTSMTNHHIVFQFKNVYKKQRMKSTNDNAGGYSSTEVYSLLNNGFKNGLANVIGVEPYKIRRLLDTGQASQSFAWKDDTCFVPSVVEIYGSIGFGIAGYNSSASTTQFPFYQMFPQERIKYFEGQRWWWWLADSTERWSTTFCLSHGNGGGR